MNVITRFVTENRGDETVDYALVLGLNALAAFAGLTLLGDQLTTLWTNLVTSLLTFL